MSEKKSALTKYIALCEEYLTPEQYKELTGEEWPVTNAIYYNRFWYTGRDDIDVYHGWASGMIQDVWEAQREFPKKKVNIICATAAGCPPDDWRPESITNAEQKVKGE